MELRFAVEGGVETVIEGFGHTDRLYVIFNNDDTGSRIWMYEYVTETLRTLPDAPPNPEDEPGAAA